MTTVKRSTACLVAGLLVVAALAGCGGSSTGKSGAGAGSGNGSEKGPIKLVGLYQVKGESSYAVNYYQYGIELAVKNINADGGINGHKLEYSRITADPSNVQQSHQAFLQAVQKSPSAILGFPSAPQLQALTSLITRSKIPVIATQVATSVIAYGDGNGSEYAWVTGTEDTEGIDFAIKYFTKKLGLTKFGVMGGSTSFGQAGQKAAVDALAKAGLKPIATPPSYSPTATDVTKQVLAMKGAELVVNWGYPNPTVVQLKQLAQNGIDVPTFANAGSINDYAGGAFSQAGVIYTSATCNTDAKPYNSRIGDFESQYKAAYDGSQPNTFAAESYDAVHIIAAAIKKAGSSDPAAINQALSDVTVQGVCSKYHADDAHFLAHSVVLTKYGPHGSGPVEVQAQGTVPPVS